MDNLGGGQGKEPQVHEAVIEVKAVDENVVVEKKENPEQTVGEQKMDNLGGGQGKEPQVHPGWQEQLSISSEYIPDIKEKHLKEISSALSEYGTVVQLALAGPGKVVFGRREIGCRFKFRSLKSLARLLEAGFLMVGGMNLSVMRSRPKEYTRLQRVRVDVFPPKALTGNDLYMQFGNI